MKVLFAGTPEFACQTLTALFQSQHDVIGVLTQADKPVGRGRKLQASPVKQLAQQYDCTVLQPTSLKKTAVFEQIKQLNPDVIVVVAYGMLFPETLLQLPKYGCINVHASLLPRWRGASPIQAAILHGDSHSGVSIMQMESGLDTGPVFLSKACEIRPGTTAQSLHDQLALLGAESLLTVLNTIPSPKPQDGSVATYAPKITKKDGLIDWTKSASDLICQIYAFNPWPVAYSYLNGMTIRCWLVDPNPMVCCEIHAPGTIVSVSKQGLDVMTGNSELLRLTQLQLPGKRVLPIADLMNAHQNLFVFNQQFSSGLT